jgi:predicted DNA-binding antitoxin AbrB/MazE fold protein
MSQIVNATYEDGVLKPLQPLDLPSHATVRVTVELLHGDVLRDQQLEALRALEDLWRHSRLDSHGERLSREQLHADTNVFVYSLDKNEPVKQAKARERR